MDQINPELITEADWQSKLREVEFRLMELRKRLIRETRAFLFSIICLAVLISFILGLLITPFFFTFASANTVGYHPVVAGIGCIILGSLCFFCLSNASNQYIKINYIKSLMHQGESVLFRSADNYKSRRSWDDQR